MQVHGLVMFRRYLPGPDDIVVELVPRRSRDVLTASRDQLHGEFADQLDQFIADLASNRRAALRPAAEPVDIRVGGGGFLATFAAPTPSPSATPGVAQTASGPALGAFDVQDTSSPDTGHMVQLTPASEQSAAYATARGLSGTTSPAPAHRDVNGLGFDVYLYADAPDATIRKLVRAWDPTSWDQGTGARRRTLLLTWKAAVAYALDTLVRLRPDLEQVSWTVGWVFDAGTRALHKTVDGGHVLALNPVHGKPAYRATSRTDRRTLLAIAAHEVAHIVADTHDEHFATVLTDLFAALDPADADRRMRSAARR